MKTVHFISGLPRSGSTLLSSILNQNPSFHADISSPLARFVRAVVTESFAGPGYKLQCPEKKRIKLIQSLIETYYYDKSQQVCFNTNRGWTALTDLLETTHPDSKIICCIRDINWILDSFERLFRTNPFAVSSMYSQEEAENVYTRTQALMSPGHTVRFALDALKEAITGYNRHKLMLVEYDQLSSQPLQTMKALYKFINQPYYEHDFNNVEASYDEFDEDANIKGLHTIRKSVSLIKRDFILPPDIIETFRDAEVWRS